MKLVDTSSWIDYLRNLATDASLRVEKLVLAEEAGWCEMVVVELWNGARGNKEKLDLADLESEVTLFPVDALVWQKATKLAKLCRNSGLTIPSGDLIVAACASHYGLEIEHCDRHFDILLPHSKNL